MLHPLDNSIGSILVYSWDRQVLKSWLKSIHVLPNEERYSSKKMYKNARNEKLRSRSQSNHTCVWRSISGDILRSHIFLWDLLIDRDWWVLKCDSDGGVRGIVFSRRIASSSVILEFLNFIWSSLFKELLSKTWTATNSMWTSDSHVHSWDKGNRRKNGSSLEYLPSAGNTCLCFFRSLRWLSFDINCTLSQCLRCRCFILLSRSGSRFCRRCVMNCIHWSWWR